MLLEIRNGMQRTYDEIAKKSHRPYNEAVKWNFGFAVTKLLHSGVDDAGKIGIASNEDNDVTLRGLGRFNEIRKKL